MNVTKLGLRISSSLLATALSLAPIEGAWAAPADGADAPSDDGAEAPADGAEEQPAEGEGEVAEGEPAEGEGEGEPAEGESAEGEGAEGEPAEGEGVEGEGEPAEEEPAEEEPAEEEPAEEEPAEAEEEALPIAPAGPMKPAEPTWGPKDQYPMTGKGMLITGGVVTGLGAAFIVTSVLVTACDFDSALSCKYGDQRSFLVPSAVAVTGLGLLLVGVGIGNRIKYKRWQNWSPETAVVPTMVPGGGGGVSWVGRF